VTRSRLPIVPSTVKVLGSRWTDRKIAWAGLFFHLAEVRENSLLGPDHHLRVPFAHPDNPYEAGECFYRVRPRDSRYRFVRAVNGQWVLERRA